MGIPHSKVGEEIKLEEPVEGSVPSTPILTPKLRTLEDLDPRSPSSNIVRTPIQLSLSPDTFISSAPESDEANRCDTFNINSPVPKPFDLDPRSPSTDFHRTPLVLSEICKQSGKPHNKNLDNVRKTLLNITPKKISMCAHVPPKLLDSSPLALKPSENKRKSFIGLLETNLDYVETDLDEAYRNKSAPPDTPMQLPQSDGLKSPATAVENEGVDPRSPTNDFLRTPIFKKVGEIDLNKEGIEAEAVVDDDGLIGHTENAVKEREAPKVTKVELEKKPKVDSNITDFDKKISTLIYTDEDADVVPKSVKVKDGNRTPLGVRNGPAKKLAPKLKVSDKPRKSDFAVSKIPVFKDKKSVGVSKQSENIPPKDLNGLTNKNAKRAQWDSNNTLIV